MFHYNCGKIVRISESYRTSVTIKKLVEDFNKGKENWSDSVEWEVPSKAGMIFFWCLLTVTLGFVVYYTIC